VFWHSFRVQFFFRDPTGGVAALNHRLMAVTRGIGASVFAEGSTRQIPRPEEAILRPNKSILRPNKAIPRPDKAIPRPDRAIP